VLQRAGFTVPLAIPVSILLLSQVSPQIFPFLLLS